MAENFKLIGSMFVCLFSLLILLALPDWVFGFVAREIALAIWFVFLFIVMALLMR